MSDTVSVIIPAYNASAFVAEAIECALAQTCPPVEVIVVNDGSTDDTPRILDTFAGRITVVNQANAGLAAARNAGARVAQGEWLAFLDADDLWRPDKLARQLELTRYGHALIYADRTNVGDIGDLPTVQSIGVTLRAGDIFEALLTAGNFITASSAMIRADVFRALGGFDERLNAAEDWDLWLRLAEQHRVGVCKVPVVSYRVHAGMMSGDPLRMQQARLTVIERALTSERGRRLPWHVKRQIRAKTARSNANGAARAGVPRVAMAEYARAFRLWPASAALYHDAGRFLLGRW